MDQRTMGMFVSTCNYLNFLIDEIMSSNLEIPPDTVVIINDLMTKLFHFMSHLYRGNKEKEESVGEKRDSSIVCSYPPTNLPTSPQVPRSLEDRIQNLSYRPPEGPMLVGQKPTVNIGIAKSKPNLNLSNRSVHQDTKISTKKLDCEPFKNQANHKSFFVADSTAPSQVKDKLVTEAISSFPVYKEKVPQGKVVPVSTEIEGNKIAPDKKTFKTKLYCNYIYGVLDGTIKKENMGIYCRICDMICLTPWPQHIKDCLHVNKAKWAKNLKMYSCRLCKLCLFGSQHLILDYYEYHFKIVHKSETNLKWEETLVEIDCLGSGNSSTSSSHTSLNTAGIDASSKAKRKRRKSTPLNQEHSHVSTTTSSSNKITTDKTTEVNSEAYNASTSPENKSSQYATTQIMKFFNNSTTGGGSIKTGETFTNTKHEPPATLSVKNKAADVEKPSSQTNTSAKAPPTPVKDTLVPSEHPQFDSLLSEMLQVWKESGIAPPAAYCSLCKEGIMSAFDWYSHVEGHTENKTPGTTKACSTCGLQVFGSDCNKIFKLPNHCKIDTIFQN